jgi:hypothetical protein
MRHIVGATRQETSQVIIDMRGRSGMGLMIQVPIGATDVYVSKDKRSLETDAAAVPPNGIRVIAGGAAIVLPFFSDILYGRAVAQTVIDAEDFQAVPVATTPAVDIVSKENK